MKLLRSKSQTVEVGALAAELANSEAETARRIEEARAQHDATRQSVIDRGTQQAQNARRLEAEARAEAEALEDLVRRA